MATTPRHVTSFHCQACDSTITFHEPYITLGDYNFMINKYIKQIRKLKREKEDLSEKVADLFRNADSSQLP